MKTTLSDAIEDFHAHRVSRGLARATLKNDRQVLRQFLTVVGNIYVHNIHEGHVDQHFQTYAKTRKPESLNVDHTVLTGFFKWAVRTKRTGRFDDPMAGRVRPKFTKRAWRGVPLSKFTALLDVAEDPRNRILLAKGIYLLGRSSELTTLRLMQVDLDSGWIHYPVPKSHKNDEMPICAELDRELRRWFTYYAEQCGPLQSHWFLIPRRRRPSVSNGRVIPNTNQLMPEVALGAPHRIVRDALEAVGYPVVDEEGKTLYEGVHTLRRSGARALYEELSNSGVPHPVAVVQACLHHSTEKQTRHYIGMEADRVHRNETLRGKLMFPSLAAGNVTSLDGARSERWASGS